MCDGNTKQIPENARDSLSNASLLLFNKNKAAHHLLSAEIKQ